MKKFGTDEAAADTGESIEYLRSHAEELDLSGEIDEMIEDVRRELVRRVTVEDRNANRDVYDALENE